MGVGAGSQPLCVCVSLYAEDKDLANQPGLADR